MFNSLFGDSSGQGLRFKVYGDKTFERQGFYYDQEKAENKGEDLKYGGRINQYRVEKEEVRDEDGFVLWIH